MVVLTVVTVGTLKEDYLVAAVDEYKKRLSAYARVEEVNLKEERIRNEEDENEIAAALRAEGEKMLARVPKEAYKIALCVEGEMPSSPGLAQIIAKASAVSGKIALFIGSSHGLSPEVKAAADYKLSVSRLTFPHQLMRVILAEVLYRAFTINAGKKYHK